MGALTVETGREAITAIVGDLDTLVATAKNAGDERTPGQIRADELVHRMTLGAFGAPAHPGSNPFCVTHASSDASPGGDSGSSPAGSAFMPNASDARPAGSPVVGVRALRVSLTMPLATWLGVAQDPGELDGYGPIPAALARQIAQDAARDHPASTTWRCVPIDDVHRTVLGVGDTIPTPRHDPTPRQRDLVSTADPTCVWPGCGHRSTGHGVDIDHRIPHDQGGATCPCNLQPLCRKHHRMKGSGLITSAPDPHARAGVDAPRATRSGPPCPGLDLLDRALLPAPPRARQVRRSSPPTSRPSSPPPAPAATSTTRTVWADPRPRRPR